MSKNAMAKIVEINKQELSSEKVELAGSIVDKLKYYIGVENFSKNIDIGIEEIESAKNSLKVDIDNLMDDMGTLAQGINAADKAAQLMGISTKDIPNYDKAIKAAKLGFKQESKAKKYLK